MNREWTQEDENKLSQLYPMIPTDELMVLFNRSKMSLVNKAHKMGIKKINRADNLKYIYEEEKRQIAEYGKHHTVIETSKHFNREYTAVLNILIEKQIDIIPNAYWWAPEEEDFLKENFESGDPVYLSNVLGRRWRTICRKARSMGMKRMTKSGIPHKSPRSLSDEEKLFIVDNIDKIPLGIMSQRLNRKNDVIARFCKHNGLNIIRSRKNPKDYSNEFLLEELKKKSVLLGRCPTSGEMGADINLPSVDIYYDRFGTFSNACDLAGLDRNIGYYGTLCYSKKGDVCYSISEQIITNYLIDNNIDYIKEYAYYNIIPSVETSIAMDWYIHGVVVEYFGMQNFEKYELRTEMKQLLCQENNIRIISIFPEDMKYLNKIFQEFINKNP